MAVWICELCGCEFKHWRNRSKVYRFCSSACYRIWAASNESSRFKRGVTPWNKGSVGIMKRNSGTFQKGRQGAGLPIGSVRIRKDKTGAKRVWVKVSADKHSSYDWRLRAVVVWEAANGKVPNGWLVHHKDRNTLNDDLANLQAMTRSQHMEEHREEHLARKRSATSIAPVL